MLRYTGTVGNIRHIAVGLELNVTIESCYFTAAAMFNLINLNSSENNFKTWASK
jgi:hypothetical protein